MSTPFLNRINRNVNFNRRLVYKFFVDFSLFEYALKQAGYLKSSSEATADWERFAQTFDTQFQGNTNKEVQAAVQYLLNDPPRKQCNDSGSLLFRATTRSPGQCDTEWLSILIRRIRNNLFHGGKFEYDPIRDTTLLKNALIILEVWAQLDSNVANEFRNVR